ncbi:aldo/keto reductase [Acetobacter aceti]|uniref:Putative oxidoreductase n=1 Tax=Acetobacter aceti TaxID=435 RepID=A0A6S6PFT0_ACEAC|nr:aldo/keto reductase [Acetobacter aceti]BCI65810.1 putative oxidoreductase [Acetobacter aceti]
MVNHPFLSLNAGIDMPQVGLGVWKTPPEKTTSIVRYALNAGYLAVDTASIYGNEEGVGEALVDRPEIFLTTKLWNADQGFDSTLRAFEESARKLRRDVIDLYLIHWPVPKKHLYVETWRAMIRLRDEGRVRAIGVSNFTAEQITALIAETGTTPAINQIELHPEFQQHSLRDFHKQHGILTEAWSPLGQGQTLSNPVIEAIAKKHERTAAQIIIRWHIQNQFVVIPKSVTPSRLDENLAVFDFRLDGEDMAAIGRLDRANGRIGPDPMTADF